MIPYTIEQKAKILECFTISEIEILWKSAHNFSAEHYRKDQDHTAKIASQLSEKLREIMNNK
jgi:predicted house-cleaning noncanonical NTP pyrophosphatase (MazG superfamily)